MRYLRRGKSSVETGELRERIEICERILTTDRKRGEQKAEYKTILKTFAKVTGESGREFFGRDTELNQVKKKIFVRRRKSLNLNENHFIKYQNHIYNIYEIFPLDTMFYEIRVERVEK